MTAALLLQCDVAEHSSSCERSHLLAQRALVRAAQGVQCITTSKEHKRGHGRHAEVGSEASQLINIHLPQPGGRLPAASWCAAVSAHTLTNTTASPYSSASASKVGAIRWQGPHQVAVKSAMGGQVLQSRRAGRRLQPSHRQRQVSHPHHRADSPTHPLRAHAPRLAGAGLRAAQSAAVRHANTLAVALGRAGRRGLLLSRASAPLL